MSHAYMGRMSSNIKNCESFEEVKVVNQPSLIKTNDSEMNLYVSLNDKYSETNVYNQNISPSYYPDMTQKMIGKRPVYSVTYNECEIPNTLNKNNTSLTDKQFNCTQPNWSKQCM